ncbi:hypothetical protein B0H19DRAFT_1079650 [Mycena capillaripes]|nr:hypothetical protein B0H19DRAFT_1079650 [Mycena capillaripes]
MKTTNFELTRWAAAPLGGGWCGTRIIGAVPLHCDYERAGGSAIGAMGEGGAMGRRQRQRRRRLQDEPDVVHSGNWWADSEKFEFLIQLKPQAAKPAWLAAASRLAEPLAAPSHELAAASRRLPSPTSPKLATGVCG